MPTNLTADQQLNYDALQSELSSLLASEPACYADGNLDKQVTQADVDGVLEYWGQPSWFDVNRDGTTDQMDLDCVMANLGNNCLESGPGANCPTPAYLNNPMVLPSGDYQFIFTGTPGTAFEVLGTTNLSMASSAWPLLDAPIETSPGQFLFIDSPPADSPPIYYQVRTP